MRCWLPAVLAVALVGTSAAAGPAKRLIEYGGDRPAPSFVRANVAEMEKQPFDGVIMLLPERASYILSPEPHREGGVLAAELEALRQIPFRKFTHNFLLIQATAKLDWFSDAEWAVVTANLGRLARAGRQGRNVVGLCFDPEPYGDSPWLHAKQAQAGTRTPAECRAMVRRRGAQFMEALQDEWPGCVLHTFFLLSEHLEECMHDGVDRRARARDIAAEYEMYPDFANGLLDAARPGVTLTDGNEDSYYYKSAAEFRRAREGMRRGALRLVDPANARRYRAQVQASQALYVNYVFNMLPWNNISAALTPDERLRWFEHNTYHALATADEYVWCYSEKMSWWERNWNIPDSRLAAAIESARRKVRAGVPLGFDLKGIFARASRQVTGIRKVGHPPAVDGRLDDPCWVEPAGATRPAGSDADLDVRLAWDEGRLYVGVRCRRPPVDEWLAVSLQTPGSEPSYEFFLNARGERRHRLNTTEGQTTLGGEWEAAARRVGDMWCAEVVVPWDVLRINSPKVGEWIRGSVRLEKPPGGVLWQPVFKDFGFSTVRRLSIWAFR